MSTKRSKPFWPELPRGRGDIDHVHDLLLDWAEWADLGCEEAEKNNTTILFLNSVVHVIECALILLLAPYAIKRGFDSAIFQDSNEFMHAYSGHVFQNGYPLEMAQALSICYSFEAPWEMSPEWAKKYADELTWRLKDIALWEVEESEFWKQRTYDEVQKGAKFKNAAEKFTKGRKTGARSPIKKYVATVLEKEDLKKTAKELWKVLVDAVSSANDGKDRPLYIDDEKLFSSASYKEYPLKTFENHCTELRKIKNLKNVLKNPHKCAA